MHTVSATSHEISVLRAAIPNPIPSDLTLLRRLEDGPEPGQFGHPEHVRLAWLFVRAYPLPQALESCGAVLRGLAARAGTPERYHQTVTWAYLILVNERAHRDGSPSDWDAFAQRFPELLEREPGILSRYYRPETLGSELARTTFVMPDLAGARR